MWCCRRPLYQTLLWKSQLSLPAHTDLLQIYSSSCPQRVVWILQILHKTCLLLCFNNHSTGDTSPDSEQQIPRNTCHLSHAPVWSGTWHMYPQKAFWIAPFGHNHFKWLLWMTHDLEKGGSKSLQHGLKLMYFKNKKAGGGEKPTAFWWTTQHTCSQLDLCYETNFLYSKWMHQMTPNYRLDGKIILDNHTNTSTETKRVCFNPPKQEHTVKSWING